MTFDPQKKKKKLDHVSNCLTRFTITKPNLKGFITFHPLWFGLYHISPYNLKPIYKSLMVWVKVSLLVFC